ncbi:MAG TPA: enoyl-CoA hydratase-related protein [Acidimicrobiia bacterium]|jgi:enoyl-CoA hydratase/carnithine racemase|nr:enoyl-CoA hydratase-related protein [Acidimicrobiia bacterium]
MAILEVVDDARVRVVTLNRPDALNAFNDELYHLAGVALEEADASNDIACVVITGAGRAFSAGQDLGEMGRLSAEGDHDFGDAGPGFPHFLDTLAAFGKPVIAAVNGIGVGIGMTMLLHVDIAFMSTTARLRAPFVPLGVVPEAAGSLLMPVVMGNQRAALKLYTGDWITADEAVECGLALRTVEPDALMTETMDLARRIAKMPVASLSATKRVVVEGRIDAVRAARAREDRAFTGMIGRPANMEAIAAFLEKREPDFSRL